VRVAESLPEHQQEILTAPAENERKQRGCT